MTVDEQQEDDASRSHDINSSMNGFDCSIVNPLASACRRAMSALALYPSHEDVSGNGPKAIVDAAIASVRHLRRLRGEEMPFTQRVDDGINLHRHQFDEVCDREIAPFGYKAAIEILQLVRGWLHEYFILDIGLPDPTNDWDSEPDWITLEKLGVRLTSCVIQVIAYLKSDGSEDALHEDRPLESYLAEIDFRLHRVNVELNSGLPDRCKADCSQSYVRSVLTEIHAPNLVTAANVDGLFAIDVAIRLAKHILLNFHECGAGLMYDAEWMDNDDREWCENAGPPIKFSAERIEKKVAELKPFDLWPDVRELGRLRQMIVSECAAARRSIPERCIPGKFRRVPLPSDLGFPRIPEPDPKLQAESLQGGTAAPEYNYAAKIAGSAIDVSTEATGATTTGDLDGEPNSDGYVRNPVDGSAYVSKQDIIIKHTAATFHVNDRIVSQILAEYAKNGVRWTRPISKTTGKPHARRLSIHLVDWMQFVERSLKGNFAGDDEDCDTSQTQTEIDQRAAEIRHSRAERRSGN